LLRAAQARHQAARRPPFSYAQDRLSESGEYTSAEMMADPARAVFVAPITSASRPWLSIWAAGSRIAEYLSLSSSAASPS
jgi:hypothetical protein